MKNLLKKQSAWWVFFIVLVGLCTLYPAIELREAWNSQKSVAILLTGTGSSGKSSTTRSIEKQSGDSYKVINIDDFIDGNDWENIKKQLAVEWGWNEVDGIDLGDFIGNYLDQANREEDRKKFDDALQNGAVQYCRNKVESSKKVVIDTVQPYFYHNFSTIVSNSLPVKVLLYCPLSIIGERIASRNLLEDSNEHRDVWCPFLAFTVIYKIQEFDDEIVVDRIVYSDQLKQLLLDSVDMVKKFHFSTYDSPEELASFENFYAKFLQKLEEQKEVVIVLRWHCDLVVNTGINSPDEVAKIIIDYVANL